MKKRITVLFSMIILSTALFGEIELGLSYTPGSYLKTDDTLANEALNFGEDTADESILGFHVGYSFWWLFYVSYDALVVPPWFIQQITGSYDENYKFISGSGINAPGFVNFFDIGFRPRIGPFYLLGTIGINSLYIHSEYVDGTEDYPIGVNMRIGAGLKFGAFGISLVFTSIFSDFDELQYTMEGISDGNAAAEEAFINSLTPTLGFNLHLD